MAGNSRLRWKLLSRFRGWPFQFGLLRRLKPGLS